MKDILNQIYQIQFNEGNLFSNLISKEETERESELYGLLYEKLQGEDQKIFLEYIQRKGKRQNEELKASFTSGFQTAMRLLIETLKE